MGGICASSKNKKDTSDDKKVIKANVKSSAQTDNNLLSGDIKPGVKNEEIVISPKEEKKSLSENKSQRSEKSNKNQIKYNKISLHYVYKGEVEFTESYETKSEISKIFNVLLFKKSKYAEYDLLTNDSVSLTSKLNSKIYEVFPDEDEAEVTLFYLGMDINSDVRKACETSTTVLGAPLFDLGTVPALLIFNKFFKKFQSMFIKDKKFSGYGHLSAYCNGANHLFISGGENKNATKDKDKYLTDFTSIDLLHPEHIKHFSYMNVPRAWHSMIYIPNKYLFIVGGHTKTVEVFDCEKNVISIDSEMNEVRNECTLCCMNSAILYAFTGFTTDGSYLSTVERCNLRQSKRNWSMVNYTTTDNVLFEDCFYISSFFSDTTLILFASNENDKTQFNNILFDIEDEDNPTICTYEMESRIMDVCPEKLFHPMSDNTSILIPLIGNKVKIYKIDTDMKLGEEIYEEALKDIVKD